MLLLSHIHLGSRSGDYPAASNMITGHTVTQQNNKLNPSVQQHIFSFFSAFVTLKPLTLLEGQKLLELEN